MVINTNVAAQNSAALLQSSSTGLAKSLQRLSSGNKIVTPQDDAAGLAVSMKFDAQSNRIGAAMNNVSNAISYTQTQDGFLQQVSKALNRMGELSVSAQDVTKTDTDRSLYDAEFQQMTSYISNVATKDFNGVSLFNGSSKAVTIDSDASTWDMSAVDMTTGKYTCRDHRFGHQVGGRSQFGALGGQRRPSIELSVDRATIGASLARLNYTNDQLTVQRTNIDAANSMIRDVDVAQESTQYAKMNILVQSGTAMLAQANSMPQSVLKLLG